MSVGVRLSLCVALNLLAVVSLGSCVSASGSAHLRQSPPWDRSWHAAHAARNEPRAPIWQSQFVKPLSNASDEAPLIASSEPAAITAEPVAAVANPGAAALPSGAAPTGNRDVVGLDQKQIEAAFGAPNSVVHHSPATENYYRDGRCTLRVTFYPDVQTRVFRALAYEVTSDADTAEGKRFCTGLFASRLVAAK
jgi:hypothetical protein